MNNYKLPEPEFDDTRLLPILLWLFREFVRDFRALLKGVR